MTEEAWKLGRKGEKKSRLPFYFYKKFLKSRTMQKKKFFSNIQN